jgi:hypothetical protein
VVAMPRFPGANKLRKHALSNTSFAYDVTSHANKLISLSFSELRLTT